MDKKSFQPIEDINIEILILGTLPSEKSLEAREYYAHPQNRFWKTIAKITNNELPTDYESKKQLLLRHKIGLWDVVMQANRRGSSDSTIQNELPNPLDKFISKHLNLKVVAFNGKTAEKLFDNYFKRREGIKYLSLPSTSPANASCSLETLIENWQKILE